MPTGKEEQEEREHFLKVVNAFRAYRGDSRARIQRSWQSLRRLPRPQQEALRREGFEDGLRRLEECVDVNAAIIAEIVRDVASMFENVRAEDREEGWEEEANGDADEVSLTVHPSLLLPDQTIILSRRYISDTFLLK